MAGVKLQGVSKVYGTTTAVEPTDLEIKDGEFLVLVGPSGCGKTTTLRMICGLELPSAGNIFIGERNVTKLEPKDRDIAMVFQSYALYPHKNVYDNMAFGLRIRKRPKQEIDAAVRETAEMLGISQYLDRFPKELSGGQRQRVALGRAIVRHPQVFLMDEPLSNLDAKLRVQTRAELIKLHQKLKTTVIYVTHDQIEAMTMGSRLVVMKDGLVQQVGSPKEIYGYPASKFVAGFVGSPPMNFIKGTVEVIGNNLNFQAPDLTIELPLQEKSTWNGKSEAFLGIRPEGLTQVDPTETKNCLLCKVEVVEHIGAEIIIHARLGDGEEIVIKQNGYEEEPQVGSIVKVKPHQGNIHLFDALSQQRIMTTTVVDGKMF
ncbi:ABC transporter ATP-binding protein [Desulfosporosinus sp. BICA1-9]|uniref:ABC transporter ATP-binding protein n=1 Tax=Desulfosporosinus sp. BICA1-9 TaxID=1531958 RepID=UPI00054B6107|nr:ABC transporter ATP-binding protein [Desulfosporosinus sp. BICA1-9]KJS49002.1 MAG: glycerol-3-phosphate ABC transporter ATP-binding protein [Peptococcaceae bacterium BRH_c23]KJS78070.1 MAG: glycerol-3-phosphate ABC transporter ATP-binding protein [Desulfosporosinus sp. BICA1-9]HBW34141.1 ABC transporter ATP-binding protein [Desulfosporosinus sp.]